jgi:hypothetical protein
MKSSSYRANTGIRNALGGLILMMLAASPALAQDMTQALAEAAGVPQIPAFLPDKYSVSRSEALPIDGVWMISTIRKKIRIEQGRAYAVDPWLHLFVLKVQPDMVVLQNFRRTDAGSYAADDLPLMGPAEMTLNAKGNLDVVVQGMMGPVRYGLVRLEPQYPDALSAEIQAATGAPVAMPRTAPPPSPVAVAPLPGMPPSGTPATPPPVYVQPAVEPPPSTRPVAGTPADCTPIGVDQDTGQTICAY